MIGPLQKLQRVTDAVIVSFTMKLLWRFDSEALIRAIRTFADTEQDTVWQLFHQYPFMANSHVKSEVFVQILEEVFHSEQFNQLYKEVALLPPSPSSYERKALYTDAGDAWRLLVYCFIGEDEATSRFVAIRSHIQDQRVGRVLDKIIADEAGHVKKAQRLLAEVGIQPAVVQKEFVKIFFRRRYEGAIRRSKMVVSFMATIWLSLIYYALGFFSVAITKKRINSKVSAEEVSSHYDGLQKML